MQTYLRRLNSKLYRDGGIAIEWRRRRMTDMIRLVDLPARARIIDLGGTTQNWQLIDHSYSITLLNLPGTNPPNSNDPKYHFVTGDACDLCDAFTDNSFDFAFSNSTIEHVGAETRQDSFAREVKRL